MRKTCPIVLPEQNAPKDVMSCAMRSAPIARTASSIANRSVRATSDFPAASNANNSSRSSVDVNNDNYCFNETIPNRSTTSACLFESNSENNQMSATLNGQCDHVFATQYDRSNQLAELSSLNNEFLTTLLATPTYQPNIVASSSAPATQSSAQRDIMHNSEDDNERAPAFEDSRPRQLGRRSEVRNRIVSITAERNAEGNQVSGLTRAANTK